MCALIMTNQKQKKLPFRMMSTAIEINRNIIIGNFDSHPYEYRYRSAQIVIAYSNSIIYLLFILMTMKSIFEWKYHQISNHNWLARSIVNILNERDYFELFLWILWPSIIIIIIVGFLQKNGTVHDVIFVHSQYVLCIMYIIGQFRGKH